jgi:integrase
LYDKLRERQQGLVSAGRMTVKQYLESWVRDTLMVSDRAHSTKVKHEVAVRLHLVPALGKIKLAKLTPMHVQQYKREKLAAGTGRATVQQSLRTLRMALKQAVAWGMLARNVATLVEGVAAKPAERRPFTIEEQVAILRAARGDRLYAMVVLAHATGLRQSELLGLCWSDLDLEGGWVHVRKQLGRDGRRKDLKTDAARRSLPLADSAVQVLRLHKAAQDAERKSAVYWEDHGLVFTTNTGRPVSHRNAHRSWTRIVKNAGVEHRGIHHMRHAFITTLAERDVHERTAQHLAGHEDGRMTREIYTHVTRTMLHRANAVIEDAVSDITRRVAGSLDGSPEPDDGPTNEDAGQP